MKTTIAISIMGIFLVSCGSAGESRERMDNLSQRNSDSILNLVDSALNAPLKDMSLGNPHTQSPP